MEETVRKLRESHPRTVGGIATLRRSVLSIAHGQWKDRNSVGVTCSLTAIARVEQIGHHSYGVTESLGIALLSRGHSYGVTGSLGIAVLSRGHSYGVTGSLGIALLSRGHSYGVAAPISGRV